MSRDGSNPSGWAEADLLRARQTGPLDRAIGARIQRCREQRCLSVQQLGGQVGVSGQQMRKYELGQTRVSAATLYVIAHILDVPVGDLLPEDRRVVDPSQQRIREITASLSAIKDRRFLAAMACFIAAAVDSTRTDIERAS